MPSDSDQKLLAMIMQRNVNGRDYCGFRLFHGVLKPYPCGANRHFSVLLWDDGRQTVEYHDVDGRFRCRHLMPGFDPARLINALHLIEIKRG